MSRYDPELDYCPECGSDRVEKRPYRAQIVIDPINEGIHPGEVNAKVGNIVVCHDCGRGFLTGQNDDFLGYATSEQIQEAFS